MRHVPLLFVLALSLCVSHALGEFITCGSLLTDTEELFDAETSATVRILELGSDTPAVYGIEGGIAYVVGGKEEHGIYTRFALRSTDAGQTWLCLNDMLPTANNGSLWFGAMRSGVQNIYPHPLDSSRVVAISTGSTFWTLEDHGGDDLATMATTDVAMQSPTWITDVHFSATEVDHLLLSSLDENMTTYWHLSLDYGETYGYVGRPGYHLYACVLGSGHSVICECTLGQAEARLCLSEDYGATFVDFPGSKNGHQVTLGGLVHVPGGSLVYALDVTAHTIVVSTWSGSYYTSLATAIAGPTLTVPEEHTMLQVLAAGQPDYVLLATDRREAGGADMACSIWRGSIEEPAILGLVSHDVNAPEAMSTPYTLLPAFFSVTASWLSPQPVYFTAYNSPGAYHSLGKDSTTTFYSMDQMRTWQETNAGNRSVAVMGLPSTSTSYAADAMHLSLLKQEYVVERQGVLYSSMAVLSQFLPLLAISHDMGGTWELREGQEENEELWAVSTFGNVIVRLHTVYVDYQGDVKLEFSRDSGASWEQLQLPGSFQATSLQLLPARDEGDESLTFMMANMPNARDTKLIIVSLPPSRPCVGMDRPGTPDSDYEVWRVRDGVCFGGEQIEAVRRKKGAACAAPAEGMVISRTRCECTLLDLACAAPCYVSAHDRCEYACEGSGGSGQHAYIASPNMACDFDPDVYMSSSLFPSWTSSGITQLDSSGQSVLEPFVITSNQTSSSVLVAGIYGSVFGISIALCLVSVAGIIVAAISYRSLRKRSEAEVFGISAKEMQVIDDQILSPLDDSDDDLDY